MRGALLTSLLAALFTSLSGYADETTLIAVIVPRTEAVKTLGETELSLIFLRKKLYWAGSKRIRPVNLSTDQPIRRQFSQRILGSLPENQAEYWNVLYFHGTSPPHVVNSEEAMLRFVAETPGSIGYVSACKVDNRVSAIAWISANDRYTTLAPEMNCKSE